MNLYNDLLQSVQTGFIDHNIISNRSFRPELIVNDSSKNKKVLTTILRELETCSEFWFSVAFITTGGVATLMNTLLELEKRNIKGKILASQYLNFTHPEALKRLRKFDNIELRIATEGSFHSKGYLFKKGNVYNLIIGSSNLTQTALSSNKEWNLKVSASPGSMLIEKVVNEFQREFDVATKVTEKFLEDYNEIYSDAKTTQMTLTNFAPEIQGLNIKPNMMQLEALESIANLRAKGVIKALLISATGTGKTYLSAFDVKRFKPKKFLFVVHRRTIAEEAMKTFKSLLGPKISMGLYSGSQQELEADYIFSTVQTISKSHHLEKFLPEHFDYIVIDETHRAGASSYSNVLEHFKPKFLLGMTATPERTDGLDVFELFDHNIAYEIRLHQALAEDMLAPFHYYGITDLTINGEEIDDKTEFNLLTAEERVDRIVDHAELYGCDDGNVRGLIFCSRKEECRLLSLRFNEKGYNTIHLTGDNSEEDRQKAIRLLESNDSEMKLDYIFSVDIFNEGIDIPKVNQIIMLRPTQSAIIFVQQLGRGLRKVKEKEYLTVIDFIGNYSNNYLVPIALYGDTSYNKDTLRKMIASGSSQIPGSSTINFDRITKEKIFESIDQASMRTKKELVHDYNMLKNQIGRTPMMMDFIQLGSRDPWLYVVYKKSYFNFVEMLEESYKDFLNLAQKKLLENFGLEINNAKRVEESIILKGLVESGSMDVDHFKELIIKKFGYTVADKTIESCIDNLNFKFVRQHFENVKIIDNKFIIGSDLKKWLVYDLFEDFLLDNIEYSIDTFSKNFIKDNYVNGFVLYNKYTRKDVCRILNWERNDESTVYGYKIHNNAAPLFVTYHKADDISESTKYEDHFINNQEFAWMSKSNRNLGSKDVLQLKNAGNSGLRILLFIQKSNDEGRDFYYMGDVSTLDGSLEQKYLVKAGKQIPVVHFRFSMNVPVDDNIYNYLTNG